MFDDDSNEGYYGQVGQAPDPSKLAYTPDKGAAQTYKAQQVGANALAGASGDSTGQSAQRMALARMQEQAKGGTNAADKASLYNALGQNAAQAHGQQGAILQGAAAHGGVNAGTTLAAQLSAAQGAQQAGSDAAVNVAGQAANRAQAANAQAGTLGGELDQSAFAKQATRGNAQNAINAADAAAANKASEFGATATNDMSKFNITNSVQAKQFLAQLQQQQYADQLAKAKALADTGTSDDAHNLDKWKAIMSGVGSAVSMFGLASGGQVGGEAPVPGDSPKNDTVPAMLSPGEIVIPRSAAGSPDKILDFLEKETGLQFDSAVKARSGQGRV